MIAKMTLQLENVADGQHYTGEEGVERLEWLLEELITKVIHDETIFGVLQFDIEVSNT